MRTSLLLALCLFAVSTVGQAAGFVHNENFIVFAPAGLSQQVTQDFAQTVLIKAEEYRKQISLEWFGEELPPGIGRTTINVTFSTDRDSGLTWAVDHPDRKLHTIYLYTTPERAVGSTLAHEVAHAVLATQFPHPHRLPAWVEEGIAGQYDHSVRRQSRASVLKFFARQDDWPSLAPVLGASNIAAADSRSYAIAVSLTEMLVSQGGKAKFLEFGRTASRDGIQRALERHYHIREVTDLQARWQGWVSHGALLSSDPLSQRNHEPSAARLR